MQNLGRCDGRYGSIGGSGSRYQTRRRIPFSLADMVLAGTTSAVWHIYGGLDSPVSDLQCTCALRYELHTGMHAKDRSLSPGPNPPNKQNSLRIRSFYPHLRHVYATNETRQLERKPPISTTSASHFGTRSECWNTIRLSG